MDLRMDRNKRVNAVGFIPSGFVTLATSWIPCRTLASNDPVHEQMESDGSVSGTVTTP